MKRPRGICKVCGQEVAVRRDGTLQGHGFTAYWPQWCQGSLVKGWKKRPRPDYSEAT